MVDGEPASSASTFIALLHFEGDAARSRRLLSPSRADPALLQEPRSTAFGRLSSHDEFLRGFAFSSGEISLVVWPTSFALPPSRHDLAHLPWQPAHQLPRPLPYRSSSYLRAKVVFLETVPAVAPKIRELVNAELFQVTKAVSGLFGDIEFQSGREDNLIAEGNEQVEQNASVPSIDSSPRYLNTHPQSVTGVWISPSPQPVPAPSPVQSPSEPPSHPWATKAAAGVQTQSTSASAPPDSAEKTLQRRSRGGKKANRKSDWQKVYSQSTRSPSLDWLMQSAAA
ncbi:hypothetical protein JCM11251_005760 [Rhodosporidiobolus azoricus]